MRLRRTLCLPLTLRRHFPMTVSSIFTSDLPALTVFDQMTLKVILPIWVHPLSSYCGFLSLFKKRKWGLNVILLSIMLRKINFLLLHMHLPWNHEPECLPLSSHTSILTYFSSQVDAIMAIKFEYGVKKNWAGDPCFPTIYAWDGVECSNTSGNTTRITSLWVSKSVCFHFLLFSFLQVLVVQFIIGASDLNIGFQIAMQRPLQ